MPRERVNGPRPTPRRERVGRPESAAVARIRARAAAAGGDIELSDDDLQALADEGIDPDEVRAVAAGRDVDEVSEFDRDTARDEVEGLRGDDEWA